MHADESINERLEYLLKWNSVVLCEHGGTEIVAYDLDLVGKLPTQGVGSLVVFSGDEGILTRGGRTIKRSTSRCNKAI